MTADLIRICLRKLASLYYARLTGEVMKVIFLKLLRLDLA